MWPVLKPLKHAAKGIIDLLLPPICPVTRQVVDDSGLLHADVWQLLRPITAPFCQHCGAPMTYTPQTNQDSGAMVCAVCLADPPDYTIARSALIYDDASRKMILAFKHGDQQHLRRPFAQQLFRLMAGLGTDTDSAIIIPVPLHRFRLWSRRYNQAALLATSLARLTRYTVCLDALVRTRATESQGHKKREARRKNVAGAFAVHPKRIAQIKGRIVIVVDDVMTTGSTFESCAKALKAGGAEAVICLSVARVVHTE
ncbi:MAG: ComF family protein [Pseudomonadota bacterium]